MKDVARLAGVSTS
ncbi:TPA: LacI family DNA-binding transcriptional regulator, partial [Escherichia coli]|nr:LacI family DNA-binding transcriptional regulator [Escherichia coli]HEG7779439.1 LacI family DNA-binding transcriptional regulator [Escherichia coli]